MPWRKAKTRMKHRGDMGKRRENLGSHNIKRCLAPKVAKTGTKVPHTRSSVFLCLSKGKRPWWRMIGGCVDEMWDDVCMCEAFRYSCTRGYLREKATSILLGFRALLPKVPVHSSSNHRIVMDVFIHFMHISVYKVNAYKIITWYTLNVHSLFICQIFQPKHCESWPQNPPASASWVFQM